MVPWAVVQIFNSYKAYLANVNKTVGHYGLLWHPYVTMKIRDSLFFIYDSFWKFYLKKNSYKILLWNINQIEQS